MHKRNRLKKIILFSATVMMIAVGSVPRVSAAVEPGCYKTVELAYEKTSCPTPELQQRAADGGICFVVATDSSYTQKSCSEITLPGQQNATGQSILESDCDQPTLSSENCQIIKYLVNGINFLSALAGMAIVASIMIAGYQYMTARDNSGQVEAAKKRIVWAMIALAIFIFMFAFLNWVVPGGLITV